MSALIVHYTNAKGEPDYLFTVKSMLDVIIESIIAKGAKDISVSPL